MIAIGVNNLGKKFKLYASPMGRFLEYLTLGKMTSHTDFWALQDITFEIPAGTTLGVLGQNGSGKSTLLSILAGVLDPSAGSFVINGKVSAILELGSGFHQDFSGRDNVYMYGSIMGLSKQQIDERFDEIVRFSELGDFIDQPLRTYSTGMTVRLAFSVAVNVDADILIVDEALAVGDAIFQHRCFRKIREMQEAGKTILYVGHDTDAVRNICTQALLLDGGRIIERGDPNYVVNKYYALIAERERTYSEGNLIEHGEAPGEEYETGYNFVQNLKDAKVEGAKGQVYEQVVEINFTPRRAIIALPPTQIIYTIRIEPESSLAFAIGILPGAWDKIPQGVKFDIEVIDGGKSESIFSRVLQPGRNIGDRGWHNFLIPLIKFSGKTIYIAFTTSGSGEDLSYCWSAWGWVHIVKRCNANQNHQNSQAADQVSDIFSPNEERFGNKRGEIIRVDLLDNNLQQKNIFESGELAIVRIFVLLNEDIQENLTVGCTLKNKYCDVYGTNSIWSGLDLSNRKKDEKFIVEFSQKLFLNSGTYSINAGLVIVHSTNDIEVIDRRYDYLIFQVLKKERMVGIADLNASVREVRVESRY
jgi:ABC-type polysaccharide/polyol phosphate transport system ATPase subunit